MSTRCRVDVADVATELTRFPVVFLHAGSLFETDVLGESLVNEFAGRGRDVALWDIAEDPLAPENDDVTIVTGFALVAARDDRCEQLARTRAQVIAALDSGRRFLALSQVPKTRLLGCPGSQLILDARTVFLPRLSEEELVDFLTESDVPTERHAMAATFSMGLPRIASGLVRVEHESAGQHKVARKLGEAMLQDVLVDAVRELGHEGMVAVEELIVRGEWTPRVEQLDPLLVEAFRGAGFSDLHGDPPRLSLVNERLRLAFSQAVRLAIDTFVEPPSEVGEILTGLWEIERRLRWRIQMMAVEKHGSNWGSAVVASPELRARITDRVTAESAEPISEIRQVANPLEWMTLDEVLQLIEDHAEWACPPETPAAFFRRLRTALLPIRNRAAHCRLPQLGDADIVARWRRELERRLA